MGRVIRRRGGDQLLEGALFGDGVLELGPQLSVTVGGRLFASRAKVRSALSDGSLFTGRNSHTGFAPKLVVDYHPSNWLTVYAQAAEGYRAGGLNTGGGLGQAFSAASGAEPRRAYLGDELWSFEGGLRFRGVGENLRGRVAVFYAGWRDIQSDLLLPSGLPFTANLGDGRTLGLETEITYVRGGLSLSANGILEDPELDRPDPGFPTRADAGLAGVPTGSFSLRAAYAFTLPQDRRLSLTGAMTYVGPSRLTFDAQTEPPMGDYVDSRIAATLSSGRSSLTAFVENVGNSSGDHLRLRQPLHHPLHRADYATAAAHDRPAPDPRLLASPTSFEDAPARRRLPSKRPLAKTEREGSHHIRIAGLSLADEPLVSPCLRLGGGAGGPPSDRLARRCSATRRSAVTGVLPGGAEHRCGGADLVSFGLRTGPQGSLAGPYTRFLIPIPLGPRRS